MRKIGKKTVTDLGFSSEVKSKGGDTNLSFVSSKTA